ncbi:MAG: phosphatidylglycerophosphatase A [Acetobacteraceae bacterium]|nr:phosphatidylglycerophosphatase A [Acetobacteraceae bacterium]
MTQAGMAFARLIASGFGTGRVPVAAGTVASVVATLAGAALLAASPVWLATAALVATLGGLWAIRHAQVEGDPGWVTIDEFAGQFLTLLGLTHVSPAGLLTAFVLFRVLDITKLGPVGWADRQHGAFGIMADDVIAGLIGAAILIGAQVAWPTLLG